MKIRLFFACTLFLSSIGFSQTATNFNCNDCSGNNHDLFTELNSGKVIVMTWVMPCSGCIAAATNGENIASGYSTSYPGRVKFYLIDDYGNTICGDLTNWAISNFIHPDAVFSDSIINMLDYGPVGMPITVVLGGPNHTIFYHHEGADSTNALQTAIDNALNSTGILETKDTFCALSLFPNPAFTTTCVSYFIGSTLPDVKIEIFNLLGENVSTIFTGTQLKGNYKFDIDCSKFSSGIYLVKFSSGRIIKTIKLYVSR